MDDKSRKELAGYRIEKAERCLQTAERCVNEEDFETATNRSYYAVFHAIRSVMALDEEDFKHHSAVASYFRHNYIKEGIFEVELSDILRDLFDARGGSDYDDFYVISKTRVIQQVANARRFYNAIKGYLDRRLENEGMP